MLHPHLYAQAMPGILQVELAVEPEPGSEADEAGGAAGGPTHFPPVPAETPLYTHNSSSSRPATPNIALMSMATAIAPGVAVAADVAQPQSTARTPAALRPPSRGTAAYTPGASSVLPAAFTGEEDEINRRLRYKVGGGTIWNVPYTVMRVWGGSGDLPADTGAEPARAGLNNALGKTCWCADKVGAPSRVSPEGGPNLVCAGVSHAYAMHVGLCAAQPQSCTSV